MTIRNRLMVLPVLAVVVFVIAFAGDVVHKTIIVDLNITTAGDTAQVWKFRPVAFDSFTYSDSFAYEADQGEDQSIEWVSSVQTMIITPTLDQSSTYACSVAFDGGTIGIEKDYATGVNTLAALIDTLVALINGKAGLTDSVEAEDSVTYIKLVSLFSQGTFTARWTMVLDVAGGTGTLDTAAHVSLTTIEMICDTMPVLINADVGLAAFVTAANSGDTVYTVTSDDPGVAFLGGVWGGTDGAALTADSLQDTVHVQANVASRSVSTDTFHLARIIYTDKEYNSMTAMFILDTPETEKQGINGGDSSYIWLYSVFNGEYFLLDGDSVATGSCTLRVVLENTAGSDTLFKEYLALGYRMADTASDTTARFDVNLHMDWILREE